jgi:hypothetical protein
MLYIVARIRAFLCTLFTVSLCLARHRLVHIIPSGQEFDADNLLYIGTVQLVDAGLVFHIYVENE